MDSCNLLTCNLLTKFGESMEKYASIILAAGKGTRMNEGKASPIPKVMFRANGKPLIYYAVELMKNVGIGKIVVVVGYKKEIVMDYLGDRIEYAEQSEQLGTGHAVQMAQNNLEGKTEAVIIFYGDHILWKPETVKKLIHEYEREKPTIAMLSVTFQNPMFWAFGRIIRDKNQNVIGIVEQKDCAPAQLKIKESNPGFYIFEADFLWQNISKIENKNVQKEYYLTDLIEMAIKQEKKVITVGTSEENEALGINTPEQLKEAESVLKARN